MRTTRTSIALLAVLLLAAACGGAQRKEDMDNMTKVPPPAPLEEGAEKGVSGAFAGLVGDWLVCGGGCNFPDQGPLEGGAKRYYRTVYACRMTSGETEWRTLGRLDRPTAYGASVASPAGDTLYFIGGTDGGEALRSLVRVTLTAEGLPRMETLAAPLPHGWYEGSAALSADGRLCLVGGWSAPGVPMREVETIDLRADSLRADTLAPLPDGPRIQPVAFVREDELYVCGGYAPSEEGHGPVMQDRSYALSLALPGAKARPVSDAPRLEEEGRRLLFVGSAVAYDGATGQVYVAGGADYEIFKGALEREYRQSLARAAGDEEALKDFARQRVEYMTRRPEEYRFIPHLLTLDYATGEWSVVATDSAWATAGAALAVRDGLVCLVGGERKPGVRTPDIWRTNLAE